MKYELSVLTTNNRRVTWGTDNPRTAHRWFRQTERSGETIDTRTPVKLISLTRNGTEIKNAATLYA